MVKPIEESLYRWKQEGWSVEKTENQQYTLVHPRARPVLCGLRTPFQTVATVQSEMQRALRDGPKSKTAPEPQATPVPKAKSKRKPRRFADDFAQPRPPRHPNSPYRKPASIVKEPVMPTLTVPFQHAAWELAYLTLRLRDTEDSVIEIMRKRYATDERYRTMLIQRFRETSQEQIQAMRVRVEKLESAG